MICRIVKSVSEADNVIQVVCAVGQSVLVHLPCGGAVEVIVDQVRDDRVGLVISTTDPWDIKRIDE